MSSWDCECTRCKMALRKDAMFCGFCGNKVYVDLEAESIEDCVTIKSEQYNYKGEMRNHFVVQKEYGEKLFSFVPDFLGRVSKGWICDDYVWFINTYNGSYGSKEECHLRRIKMNGKKIDDFGEISDSEMTMYKTKNGYLYFLVESAGTVYLWKGKNELLSFDLGGQIDRNYGLGVYDEQVFTYKFDSRKDDRGLVFYEDGKVIEVAKLLDMQDIKKKLDVYIFDKYYMSNPKVYELLNNMTEPNIRLYAMDRGVACLKKFLPGIGEFSLRVDIYSGEVMVEREKLVKTKRCRELIDWNNISTKFEGLSRLLKEYTRNQKLANISFKSKINYVLSYDEDAVTLSITINDILNYIGVYSKEKNVLAMIMANLYLEDMNIYQHEKAKKIGTQNIYLMDSVKNELMEKYEPILEELRLNIEKHLQHKAFESGRVDYYKCSYSMNELKLSIQQVAGIMARQRVFWKYPMLLDNMPVSDSEVNGLYLIMDLSVIGYDKLMAVEFIKGVGAIWITENVSAAGCSKWYEKVNEKFIKLETPKVLAPMDMVSKVPTLANWKDEFVIKGYVGGDKFYVVTKYDDKVYPKEDPNARIYANTNFFCKVNSGEIIHPYLQNIQAYALAENGIFYVTKKQKQLFYMDKSSYTFILSDEGTNEKTRKLHYENGILKLYEFSKLQQTGCNEHFDVLGGLSEEWRDYYEIIHEERILDVRQTLEEIKKRVNSHNQKK